MQFLSVLLLAVSTVSAGVITVRQVQCAVCPQEIGPTPDGTELQLSGASAQLGAPTFCMYGPISSFQYCFFGGDGGLSTSNNAYCPPLTTTTACPPHSN